MYDNVAQLATNNSHRLCASFSPQGVVETVTEKLKALRDRSGLSVREMAAELNMPASTYAAKEDPAKFKKPIMPLDFVKSVAEVLEKYGVERGDVLRLAGITGELGAKPKPTANSDDEWLEVTGSVAAGVWRAQSDWPAGERYLVRFGQSRYPSAERFAVRMEGLSMNRTIQPGADLECLWIKFSPTPPRPGDLVIVERHNHDLVELTCKRLSMQGDDFVLLCESYEPEFQEPIMLGRPDKGSHVDDEIRVVGIVLSAKLDLAPKDLSERRYRRGYE